MHPFHRRVAKILILAVLILDTTTTNVSSIAIPLDSSSPPSTAPKLGGKGKKGGGSTQQPLAETYKPTLTKTPTISPTNQATLAPNGSILSSPSSFERPSSTSPSIASSTSATVVNKFNTLQPTMKRNEKVAFSPSPSSPPSISTSTTSMPSLVVNKEEEHGTNQPSSSWQHFSNAPSHFDTSDPSSTATSKMPTVSRKNSSSPSLSSKPSNSTQVSSLESIECYDPPLDIFGSISSHQTIVPFAYEIVYDPTFSLKDMLRALEVSIALAILRTWPIPGCQNDGSSSNVESSDIMKDIDVTGLSSRPYDVVSEKACTLSIVNDGTSSHACSLIDGRFSIFYRNPNATDYVAQLLFFIQKGMENDVFVGSHAGIVKVAFIQESVQSVNPANKEKGQVDPSSPDVDNSMLPVFAWYLVASAGVAIVGVALRRWFVKRRDASNYGELDAEVKSEGDEVEN